MMPWISEEPTSYAITVTHKLLDRVGGLVKKCHKDMETKQHLAESGNESTSCKDVSACYMQIELRYNILQWCDCGIIHSNLVCFS